MTEHEVDDRAPRPVGSTGPRPAHTTTASESAHGVAAIASLQRMAGNHAVAELLQGTRSPIGALPVHPSIETARARDTARTVQRDEATSQLPVPGASLGWRRPAADDANRLHLDPAIEAQIRAIQAMRTQLAPDQVQAQLVNLSLPAMPSELLAPPTAPQGPAPAPGAAVPQGPAPGTGLMGPRAGTGGDIWKAVLSDPTLGSAVVNLGELATARAKLEYNSLSTGGKAAVVSTSVAVGIGALTAVLAHPGARDWMTATLNDKIIPVVPVPGLGVQLNLSGNTMIIGLHLDVGKILPASLGFGPASETTPLGAPPGSH